MPFGSGQALIAALSATLSAGRANRNGSLASARVEDEAASVAQAAVAEIGTRLLANTINGENAVHLNGSGLMLAVTFVRVSASSLSGRASHNQEPLTLSSDEVSGTGGFLPTFKLADVRLQGVDEDVDVQMTVFVNSSYDPFGAHSLLANEQQQQQQQQQEEEGGSVIRQSHVASLRVRRASTGRDIQVSNQSVSALSVTFKLVAALNLTSHNTTLEGVGGNGSDTATVTTHLVCRYYSPATGLWLADGVIRALPAQQEEVHEQQQQHGVVPAGSPVTCSSTHLTSFSIFEEVLVERTSAVTLFSVGVPSLFFLGVLVVLQGLLAFLMLRAVRKDKSLREEAQRVLEEHRLIIFQAAQNERFNRMFDPKDAAQMYVRHSSAVMDLRMQQISAQDTSFWKLLRRYVPLLHGYVHLWHRHPRYVPLIRSLIFTEIH
jgi:hypothetical protein